MKFTLFAVSLILITGISVADEKKGQERSSLIPAQALKQIQQQIKKYEQEAEAATLNGRAARDGVVPTYRSTHCFPVASSFGERYRLELFKQEGFDGKKAWTVSLAQPHHRDESLRRAKQIKADVKELKEVRWDKFQETNFGWGRSISNFLVFSVKFHIKSEVEIGEKLFGDIVLPVKELDIHAMCYDVATRHETFRPVPLNAPRSNE